MILYFGYLITCCAVSSQVRSVVWLIKLGQKNSLSTGILRTQFTELVEHSTAIVRMVAAGFAPWRVRPHIDSTSDQVLKIELTHTEKKRQHCAHDGTKPHKTSLFLVH